MRRIILGVCAAIVLVPGLAPEGRAANLEGGNGVYRVIVSDGAQAHKCGVWTAVTGPLHSAGPGHELLFSVNGLPINSSYTTLRSHQSGRTYTTTGECLPLCIVAGRPQIEAVQRIGKTVGYRLAWTFFDQPPPSTFPGPLVRFVQEVTVDGPVNGTETVENSIVRETHTVQNLGPGGFRFGLRKMWDMNIDSDEGPWLGDCDTPEAACDRSLNLTRNGSLDGPYPRNLVFRSNPAEASCPAGIPPNAPDGCVGPERYVVSATVRPPTTLSPRPNPPQLLQFNWWSPLFGECWVPGLFDAAECGEGGFFDDTALAFFYGLDVSTAVKLRKDQSASFTQYLGLETSRCPSILVNDPAGATE